MLKPFWIYLRLGRRLGRGCRKAERLHKPCVLRKPKEKKRKKQEKRANPHALENTDGAGLQVGVLQLTAEPGCFAGVVSSLLPQVTASLAV